MTTSSPARHTVPSVIDLLGTLLHAMTRPVAEGSQRNARSALDALAARTVL